MNVYTNLNLFLSSQLNELKCDENTKAYIVSILYKFRTTSDDCSNDSLTLLYAQAKFKQDFHTFQKIGDWLFLCNSLFPENLKNATPEYYHSIGRSSYYSCYKLLNKQWKVYESLADLFLDLSIQTRKILIRER